MANTVIVKNWKEFVIEGTDINRLETQLKEEGWINEDDNLELYLKYKNETEKFWDKYCGVFYDEVLEDVY